MEPDLDQRVTICDDAFASMDPGARACSNLRLDRNVHPRYRPLLAAEDAAQCAVPSQPWVALLGFVDNRSPCSLGHEHLRVALASSASHIGITRVDGIRT